jgi:hypothetical protein
MDEFYESSRLPKLTTHSTAAGVMSDVGTLRPFAALQKFVSCWR